MGSLAVCGSDNINGDVDFLLVGVGRLSSRFNKLLHYCCLINQSESYCFSVFGKIRCLNADVEKLGCKTEKTLVSGSGSDDQEIIAGSETTVASVDGSPEIPSSFDDAVQEVTAASPSGVTGSQDKEEDNKTDQQSTRKRKNNGVVSSEESSSHELESADEVPSEESSSQISGQNPRLITE